MKYQRNSGKLENNEVELEVKHLPAWFTAAPYFSVGSKWNPIPFDRMIAAINKVGELDPVLTSRLLGHNIKDISLKCKLSNLDPAPGLPKLNQMQVHAVKTVMKRRLTLIQGPPGTGKTVTLATIVYHLSRIHQRKVLVVAPSNTAVDQLCKQIARTPLKVVRLCARSREDLKSPVSHLMLHTQAQNGNAELRKLQQLKDKNSELSWENEKLYRHLRWWQERTLSALPYFVLFPQNFNHILIVNTFRQSS